MPTFVTGLVLIYIFYYLPAWRLSRSAGSTLSSARPEVTGFLLIDSLIDGDFEVFRAARSSLSCRPSTMALFALAPLTRMTRASMLGVLASDFVRTARAAGLSLCTVFVTYAFRNAMMPVVTTHGHGVFLHAGRQRAGREGVRLAGHRLLSRWLAMTVADYAPLQGFVLLMGAIYPGLNLVTDILYGADRSTHPGRLRHEAMRALRLPPGATWSARTRSSLVALTLLTAHRRRGAAGPAPGPLTTPGHGRRQLLRCRPAPRTGSAPTSLAATSSAASLVAARLDLWIAVAAVAVSSVARLQHRRHERLCRRRARRA